MEMSMSQIDPNKARVFLLYSRYWHFSRYSHLYSEKKVEECKRYFFVRLIEEYTLNQWQFRYLERVIEKMNEKSPMVSPTSFILNSNPADNYLVHLTECYKLFNF